MRDAQRLGKLRLAHGRADHARGRRHVGARVGDVEAIGDPGRARRALDDGDAILESRRPEGLDEQGVRGPPARDDENRPFGAPRQLLDVDDAETRDRDPAQDDAWSDA